FLSDHTMRSGPERPSDGPRGAEGSCPTPPGPITRPRPIQGPNRGSSSPRGSPGSESPPADRPRPGPPGPRAHTQGTRRSPSLAPPELLADSLPARPAGPPAAAPAAPSTPRTTTAPPPT